MRLERLAGCIVACAIAAYAQSDRGTITGTVLDPGGALIVSAPIEARNVETGALYKTTSTATGNYSLPQLPVGSYELSVTAPGFKRHIRQGLVVEVAQTVRVDVTLEVGSTSESLTVTEAAPLLKTESGELSHNFTAERINNLPVLQIGFGVGSWGIRNTNAVTALIPGAYYVSNATVRVNGAPANSHTLRIDGQDAGNSYANHAGNMIQPSVDSVQEFAVQTSNYAAEFGQAGGGVYNYTMKSGTNQLHGSAYDYFVNEVLNAGQPFTNNGKGGLTRPRARSNDYGFTMGAPVWIPKVYNGHDKTFFFFSLEQFRTAQIINSTPVTVPAVPYRNGDFTQALTGRNLGTDPIGRSILENTVYDPSTQRAAPNGQLIRDAFPGNRIPPALMDPVASKIQALMPAPQTSGLVNNLVPSYRGRRITTIWSAKIDELLISWLRWTSRA
jgi:hypothetical protein